MLCSVLLLSLKEKKKMSSGRHFFYYSNFHLLTLSVFSKSKCNFILWPHVERHLQKTAVNYSTLILNFISTTVNKSFVLGVFPEFLRLVSRHSIGSQAELPTLPLLRYAVISSVHMPSSFLSFLAFLFIF